MKDNFLIKDFEILRYNINKDFALQISKTTGKELSYVEKLFEYNLLTPDQVADLLGMARSTIDRSMLNVNKRNGNSTVNYHITYPFRVSDTIPGPIFVVVDHKLFTYIKNKLNIQ